MEASGAESIRGIQEMPVGKAKHRLYNNLALCSQVVRLQIMLLSLVAAFLILPLASTSQACQYSQVGNPLNETVTLYVSIDGTNPQTASSDNAASVSDTSSGFTCNISGYYETQAGGYWGFATGPNSIADAYSFNSGQVGTWSETAVTQNSCSSSNTPALREYTHTGICVDPPHSPPPRPPHHATVSSSSSPNAISTLPLASISLLALVFTNNKRVLKRPEDAQN